MQPDFFIDWDFIVYVHCVSPQNLLLTFSPSIRPLSPLWTEEFRNSLSFCWRTDIQREAEKTKY